MHIFDPFLRNENVCAGGLDIGDQIFFGAGQQGIQGEHQQQGQRHATHAEQKLSAVLSEIFPGKTKHAELLFAEYLGGIQSSYLSGRQDRCQQAHQNTGDRSFQNWLGLQDDQEFGDRCHNLVGGQPG